VTIKTDLAPVIVLNCVAFSFSFRVRFCLCCVNDGVRGVLIKIIAVLHKCSKQSSGRGGALCSSSNLRACVHAAHAKGAFCAFHHSHHLRCFFFSFAAV
jgi:hypothetical protein